MEEKYESIGKKYNGEKAIISLTSWKARIDTVGKTLFSLLKMCPGFHIVLVLSEEEFPQKEKELPENLMIFVKKDFIEILWIYPNWKSFKKVLPTMDKYRNVPVISADDDCIYTRNYAQELYDKWEKHKDVPITYWCSAYKNTLFFNTAGYATLHPPYYFGDAISIIDNNIIKFNEDDLLYIGIRIYKNLQGCISLNKSYNSIVKTHDENQPIHNLYKDRKKEMRDKLIDIMVQQIKINYMKACL